MCSRYSTVKISSKTNLDDDAKELSKSAAMAAGPEEKVCRPTGLPRDPERPLMA